MASPVNRTYLRQTRDSAELLGKLGRYGAQGLQIYDAFWGVISTRKNKTGWVKCGTDVGH